MLRIENVQKAFGKKVILNEVTFEAKAGEIIGLVAPNGTGKSTLLNIIMNFVSPDSGRVSIKDDLDYSSKKNEIKMHEHLSFLPELNDLYEELSGTEHLKLYAKMWKKDVNKIQGIVNRLNMQGYVKKPVRTYSLGMRQRLAFAMILASDTDIMLMDEVMNGLDPDNVALLTKVLIELKKNGKIVLIASHLLDNLDLYADRILFFREGNILLETREDSVGLADRTFIKIPVTNKDYKFILDNKTLPVGSQFIANKLLAIPIKDLSKEDIGLWINYFIENGKLNVTIGQIGTSEWYEEFYN
ncbi:ABC transporter ATP-binding protein [Alkalibacterium olivapovliticus]|uniref:ABC-2 type transport system ATP-binding protein n=1 Tax=Alkalibacterium olivapovliticus TaxID=99907 RepID=A0A2T0VVS1_9LACT|nr:ABC transporter ATP-binding protein [Alkalibacterium olivapovliticus]PRY75910.1 ABC-2 type transport system ATP-binding protein [Alkalibacterium olivapovliticus]